MSSIFRGPGPSPQTRWEGVERGILALYTTSVRESYILAHRGIAITEKKILLHAAQRDNNFSRAAREEKNPRYGVG